ITYDYISRHDFRYGDTANKEIFIQRKQNELYCYTITLEKGTLLFKESIYNPSKDAYESTNQVYEFTENSNIISFAVGYENDMLAYTILALDKDSNVYMYEANGKDTITTLISKIKKKKTISKASKIGFYLMNNAPFFEGGANEAIYVDQNNNVRTFDSKNSLFYESAYYRYIGSDNFDQVIYVLKDGLMKYATGNTNRNLNTGDTNIKYRGSFYKQDEETMTEDIYIISTDGYLYTIKGINSKSKVILEKTYPERIKKIGYQYIRGNNGYATNERNIIIQFADSTIIKVDAVSDYELLN
ncbi:MAG: hypothetical protein K2I70_01820, partial [Bacilli bacterium]|nr:hypothetical protein [Bacilli bacterium]